MNYATYTLYKGPGDPCGSPTQFVLNIVPIPGYSFVSSQIEEMQGDYVSKIKITLVANPGPPMTVTLCNAPVVCLPDSVPLDIITELQGESKKGDDVKKDYNQAQVGGLHKNATS